MIKINNINEINPNMDKNATLQDIAFHINELIKLEGKDKVIEKAGIDKNILYRLSTGSNTGLDKFLKIKRAFPTAFKSAQENKIVSDVPILGQIIEDDKVRLLNISQPTSVKLLTSTVKTLEPLIAYISVTHTAYSQTVHLFSTANTKSDAINNECIHRLIMAYPPDTETPLYGMVHSDKENYYLVKPLCKKIICKIPFKNNIRWAKWVGMTPFSFAENFKAENTTQELQLGIDEKYLRDLQAIGKLFRDWYSAKDTVKK